MVHDISWNLCMFLKDSGKYKILKAHQFASGWAIRLFCFRTNLEYVLYICPDKEDKLPHKITVDELLEKGGI